MLARAEVVRLVEKYIDSRIPSIPKQILVPLLVSQLWVESSFRPDAVSPVGAMGLAQFMPDTWKEWGNGSPFDPENAVEAFVEYMDFLYGRFGEIPDEMERLKFAMASYNAGRGNINKMLEHARDVDGVPAKYADWQASGCPSGLWQKWWFASQLLPKVTGKHHVETRNYVDRIFVQALHFA